MATQLKQTDFAPQAAPRPNIRVVFSAGPAALAMREKLAEVPGADSTLDELAVIDTAGISPMMAALLADADQAAAAYNDYYETVYEPVNVRYFAAQGTNAEAAIKREREATSARYDELVIICSDAESAVASHPVTTAADLRIKLAFIKKHPMGDGMDWTAELLADAERIAAGQSAASDCPTYLRNADLIAPFVERNATIETLNGDGLTDAEDDALCGRVNSLDRHLLQTTALSAGDVILKLLMLAQIEAEGSEVSSDISQSIVREAQRFLGVGYIPGESNPPMPKPIADQHRAWAQATAEWRAVRQDLAATGLLDGQVDALVEREMLAFGALADLPLRTIDDGATKLRAMIDLFGHVPPEPLTDLLADLERFGARHAEVPNRAAWDKALRDYRDAHSRWNVALDERAYAEEGRLCALDSQALIRLVETPAPDIEAILLKLELVNEWQLVGMPSMATILTELRNLVAPVNLSEQGK